jgi:hypothetical protein
VTDTTALLPQNATQYELAIAEAVAAWWDVPVALLDTLWDPRKIPADLLPFLAWALSVDIWNDRWDISKKRSVTARSVALSRMRGTEPAFREFLDIVDARLVEFLPPPQGLFPKNRWSGDQLQQWRSQFPEIRVYPFRVRHVKPRNQLTIGQPWFGSRHVLRPSVAGQYGGRRATWVKNGVETGVTVRVDVGTGEFARGIFTVMLPTTLPRLAPSFIAGRGFFPRPSTAKSRVYIYGEGVRTPDLLPPGVPVSIDPDHVAAKHVVRGGFFLGHTLSMVLRRSVAAEHVYDSVRIYDPAVAIQFGTPRKGGWILGSSKLQQQPFLLRLTADLSRRRRGGLVVGKSFPQIARPFDSSRVDEGLSAVRAAKIGRDRMMVRTNLHREINPTDSIRPDGSFRVGQIIQSL